MGTNYEWETGICEKCDRGNERIHIGKQSAGWAFIFRVHPYREPPINSFRDWMREFSKGGVIWDEYEHKVLLRDFLQSALASYNSPKMAQSGDCDADGLHIDNREFC